MRLRRWKERADQTSTARGAAADAVRVGRREALGVRQLAAALFLCANNVSVPMSAFEGFLRRLRQLRIGTRDDLPATPKSGGKTQTASLSLYPTHPRRQCRCDRLTGCQRNRYAGIDQTRGVKIFANMNGFSI
ncbi:MAG TPA: hypothetical protein PLW35_11690 [Verrucomicrobiota bacterium]|nr:hypothetical protein [Verrucomicrobiota bacterium]